MFNRKAMFVQSYVLDVFFFFFLPQAFLYSLEHEVPLIAFSQDRCLTLFEHPLVDSLHLDYHEPKVWQVINKRVCFTANSMHTLVKNFFMQAEVMPSVEHLLATADIQVHTDLNFTLIFGVKYFQLIHIYLLEMLQIILHFKIETRG